MAKGVKLTFVNKNGDKVTELCHDPKTCNKHAWIFKMKSLNLDATEVSLQDEVEIKSALRQAIPGANDSLTEVTDWSKNEFAPLIDSLVADGGKVYVDKNSMNRPNDRSLKVQLRDEEFGGMFNLTLTDRDDKTLENSLAREKHGETMHYTSLSAWFVSDTVEPYAFPEYGLSFGNPLLGGNGTIPADLAELREAYTTCPVCGRNVGAGNMEHVAFANRACRDCAPDLRAKLETPGWYN